MKVFDVTTDSTNPKYHTYCAVAEDMATAERLVTLELPAGVTITEIRVHHESVIIDLSAI